MSQLIDRLWYGRKRPLWFLWPFGWLYWLITARKRGASWRWRNDEIPAPVIVVGNITAGGTGKSPLTAALVRLLEEHGWSPVIISRGYGGKSSSYPMQVLPESDPSQLGDEPVMLASATGRPVVVDPQRKRAALWAIEKSLGDILICDDGLQHYALPRDIELAVFDGNRGLGNGAPIPVGPLREPPARLSAVDFVIVNGGVDVPGVEHPQVFPMTLEPASLTRLTDSEVIPLNALEGREVVAAAGIGNPQRFFRLLEELGAFVVPRPFADHHHFSEKDLTAKSGQWVVITSKDAVKCAGIGAENVYVLNVEARLPEEFKTRFMERVDAAQTVSG